LFLTFSLLLVLLAALFVVIPLVRFRESYVVGQTERDSANLLIFRERLAELEADLASGEMEQAQFDMVKAELELTLLSDVAVESRDAHLPLPVPRKNSWTSTRRLMPLLAVLTIVPLSYFLYGLWGFEEELKVASLFERSRDSQGDPEEIRDLIFELGAVLQRDPQNGWAAYFLGRHLVSFGQMEEASRFFASAAENIEHPQDRAIVLGQMAQTQYIADGQQITERVEQTIAQAQRLNPSEPSILQLLGADAFINEDYQSAITYWQRLLSMEPDAGEAEFLRSFISQAQQMLVSAEGSTVADDTGPRIEISLSLDPGIDLPSGTRIFVSAQDPERPGPPLAARVLSLDDLPLVVRLSDADAVGPFNLSSAQQVIVVATASISGSADVQSGDLQARSDVVQIAGAQAPVRLQLQMRDVLP
jgi:cytochrome c-type biogenesis protein CcmH